MDGQVRNGAKRRVLIEYRDGAGDYSTREIQPNMLEGHFTSSRGFVVDRIHAHCMKAKASRTFLPKRIVSIADPSTGEVFSLDGWLGSLDVDFSPPEDVQPEDAAAPGGQPAVRAAWRWVLLALVFGYAVGRLRLIHALLRLAGQHWGRWL